MSVKLSKEVRDALVANRPIVALETAVLTSGLPHTPWSDSYGERPNLIDENLPINVEVAKAMTHIVQDCGVVPAWIGVLHGTLRIGLSLDEVIELASDEHATKVSLGNFAQTLHGTQSAGTTVASTLLACQLASSEHPIRVFATGGIGGIHSNWSSQLDISADLTALATSPTCVVASGAKSILDIRATVEALETIGVPILGLGGDSFPSFIENSNSQAPTIQRVESPDEVAEICHQHWHTLGLKSSVLATNPVPENAALDAGSLVQALEQGEQAWQDAHLPSTTRTPFLLHQLAIITEGKSLVANLALLYNNASTACKIARSLTS